LARRRADRHRQADPGRTRWRAAAIMKVNYSPRQMSLMHWFEQQSPSAVHSLCFGRHAVQSGSLSISHPGAQQPSPASQATIAVCSHVPSAKQTTAVPLSVS